MTEPKKSGMASVVGEDFSPMAAMGGVRGIIEACAPALLFIIIFSITGETIPSVIAAVAAVGVALVARLIQRIDLTPAIGGALGVAVSAIWAIRSGEASKYFVLGLWTNGAYAAAFIISILVTWPLLGVLVAFFRSEDQSWRTDPAQRPMKKRYYIATWLWAGLFLARLLVQLPLYLNDQVEALGIARLVMGPFMFALVAWATWMLVRRPGEKILPQKKASEADN